MSEIKDGGPAFPVVGYKSADGIGVSIMEITGGMTLRDYFAAKAMQGILAHSWSSGACTDENAAFDAYSIADAMLEARK